VCVCVCVCVSRTAEDMSFYTSQAFSNMMDGKSAGLLNI